MTFTLFSLKAHVVREHAKRWLLACKLCDDFGVYDATEKDRVLRHARSDHAVPKPDERFSSAVPFFDRSEWALSLIGWWSRRSVRWTWSFSD